MDTLKHIAVDGQCNISKIYIEFSNKKQVERKFPWIALLENYEWVLVERAQANIKLRASKNSSPVINRSHLPLMLALRCTLSETARTHPGKSSDKSWTSKTAEFITLTKSMNIEIWVVSTLNQLFITGS